MIIALSTSSPVVGVAVIADGWTKTAFEESQNNASGVCLGLLEQLLSSCSLGTSDASAFATDVGPGSFIGVRVSVTLAKTLAYATGKLCYVASSFDLINAEATVSFPSKKGEWFVREIGKDVVRVNERPASSIGFGPGVENPTYPDPARFAELIAAGLQPVDPMAVVPQYLIEPSISQPKPLRTVGG